MHRIAENNCKREATADAMQTLKIDSLSVFNSHMSSNPYCLDDDITYSNLCTCSCEADSSTHKKDCPMSSHTLFWPCSLSWPLKYRELSRIHQFWRCFRAGSQVCPKGVSNHLLPKGGKPMLKVAKYACILLGKCHVPCCIVREFN